MENCRNTTPRKRSENVSKIVNKKKKRTQSTTLRRKETRKDAKKEKETEKNQEKPRGNERNRAPKP